MQPIGSGASNRRREYLKYISGAIILLAFLLRLSVALPQTDDYWRQGDRSFLTIAQNLVDNGVYGLSPEEPTRWRGPAYVLLLAAIYGLFGASPQALAISNVVIGMTVVIATWYLARYLFGEGAAMVATLFVGFHPYLVWQSGHLIDTDILSALVLLLIHSTLKAKGPHRLIWAAVAGILAGLAVLTRAMVILFVPFVLLWWVRRHGKEGLKLSIVFVSVFVLCLLPWMARNALVFDRLTITESMAGLNLWNGNNPLTFQVYPQHSLDSLAPYRSNLVPPDLANEDQRNAWYLNEVVKYVVDEPVAALEGFLRKALLLYDFRLVPRSGENALLDPLTGEIVRPGAPRSTREQVLYTVPYLAILLLSAVALPSTWRLRSTETVLIVLLFLSWTVAHAIVFAYSRYRMPLEPLLAIWAGRGCLEVYTYLCRKGIWPRRTAHGELPAEDLRQSESFCD